MRTVEVVEGTRLGEQAFRLFQENLVLSESNITNLQARLNREARDRGYFYENPRGVARPPREIYEQTLR